MIGVFDCAIAPDAAINCFLVEEDASPSYGGKSQRREGGDEN